MENWKRGDDLQPLLVYLAEHCHKAGIPEEEAVRQTLIHYHHRTTVLDALEYRQRDSIHFYFKPLDKRVRNSISISALKEGISVWDRDVDRFLNSEFVPLHNPVEEYLYDTGR